MKRDYIRIMRPIKGTLYVETRTGYGSWRMDFLLSPTPQITSLSFSWPGYGVTSFHGWAQWTCYMGKMHVSCEEGQVELGYDPDFSLKEVIRHDPQLGYISGHGNYTLAKLVDGVVHETTYSLYRPVGETTYTLQEFIDICPRRIRSAVQTWEVI